MRSASAGHQELEADLDRLRRAEQEAALGRDQLVRPREVRRVGLRCRACGEATGRPTGREGRSAASERAGREVDQRAPERISVERARRRRTSVRSNSDRAGGREPACAGRAGPVHEEEPLFGARLPGGRLAQVRAAPCRGPLRACRRLGTSAYQRTSCSTSALPGPNTTDERPLVGRTETGLSAQKSASIPRRCARRRDRREARTAAVRRTISSHGAKDSRTSIEARLDSPVRRSGQQRRRARRDSREVRTSRRRPVRGRLCGDLGGRESNPLAGGLPTTGYRGFGVVGHAAGSRSIVSAALHEKSPGCRAARRSSARSTRRSRSARGVERERASSFASSVSPHRSRPRTRNQLTFIQTGPRQ